MVSWVGGRVFFGIDMYFTKEGRATFERNLGGRETFLTEKVRGCLFPPLIGRKQHGVSFS